MAKKNKKQTFASVADKLTKKIGALEDAATNGDKFDKETASRMIPMYQSKLDSLYEKQEADKQASFQAEQSALMQKYGYGGPIGDPSNGKYNKHRDQDKYLNKSHHIYTDRPYIDDEGVGRFEQGFTLRDRARNIFKPNQDRITTELANGGAVPKYANGGPTFQEFLQSRQDIAGMPLDTQEQVYKQYLSNQGFDVPEIVNDYDWKKAYEGTSDEVWDSNSWTPHGMKNNYSGVKSGAQPGTQSPINEPTRGAQPTDEYTSSPYIGDQSAFENEGGKQGFDYKNAMYQGAMYAPTIYNTIKGLQKPQELAHEDFQNPYERQSMDLMSGRRYNIDPELEANKRNYNATARNIASGAGGSSSAYLANIGSAQSRRGQQDQRAYAMKQNMDNQYLGQEAQYMGQMGAQRAQTKLGIQDINDRNKAARDAYMGAATTGLSQGVQNQRRMNNMSDADMVRARTLQHMYPDYGYVLGEDGKPTGYMNYKG